MTVVWVNGRMLDGSDPAISALSAGVQTGVGVFEAMRVVDGRAFALTRHLRRLAESADIVGLTVPVSDDSLRGALDAVLQSNTAATKARITLVAGQPGASEPTVVVNSVTNPPWPATSHVVVSPWIRNERSPSAGAKTTSYLDNLLAMAEARGVGADEAILCDTRGNLSEGTASNVFLVVDGQLCTPSLTNGGLGGMTRELVLELVDTSIRDDLAVADLRAADEVFLTSSTRGVHPVASIDGVAQDAVPGPITTAAARALDELQQRTIDP